MPKPIKGIDPNQIENMTFEGGGVAGIGYVGALSVLEEKGILKNVKRVGGTSAGAMCALALAVGCTAEEIKEALWNINFKEFEDDDIGILRDAKRFITEFGVYKGDKFKEWLGDIIEKKVAPYGFDKDITFKQLHELRKSQIKEQGSSQFKDVYLIGTNLTRSRKEIYSYESKEFRDIPLRLAARISMSIPYFFKAVFKETAGVEKREVLVDGGVRCNDPQGIFDDYKYQRDKFEKHNAAKNVQVLSHENTDFSVDESSSELTKKPQADMKRSRDESWGYKFNRRTLALRLDSNSEIAMIDGKPVESIVSTENLLEVSVAILNAIQDAQLDAHINSKQPIRTAYISRNAKTREIKATDFNITDEEKQTLTDNGSKAILTLFAKNQERLKLHGDFKAGAPQVDDAKPTQEAINKVDVKTDDIAARVTEVAPLEKSKQKKPKPKPKASQTPVIEFDAAPEASYRCSIL